MLRYSDVKGELLRRRRFLISPNYLGVPCGLERCLCPSRTCLNCKFNMFNAYFPDVYIKCENLL